MDLQAMTQYFKVEFSTKQHPKAMGTLDRYAVILKAQDAKTAEGMVTGRFSDAIKVESRQVNRAERSRRR